MASSILISIPSTRVLEDHAEYGVSCSLNGPSAGAGSALVWRRYKDFEHLRNDLSRVSHALMLPNLPGKHSWWTSRSAQIVNERQRQLETFLREVEAGLERPGHAWNVFCQFVGLNPTVVAAALPVAMGRRENEDATNVLREQMLRLQNQMSMLEDEDAKLKLDLATKESELATLRSKRLDTKQIKEQTNQLEKEKNRLVVEVARLEALLNSAGEAQHELNLLKEENAKLKNDYVTLESERSELGAALARHEELIDSLRREVARLEDEAKRMQDEIARLQKSLENNPTEEAVRAEIAKLKKDKGLLELEIGRLETAQQSAAAYGASVLTKLEKLEKEKTQQMNDARAALEAEQRISASLRDRIDELEREFVLTRTSLSVTSKQINQANASTQEVLAANELLQTTIEGEETEVMALRKQLATLQEHFAHVSAEYQLLKTRSNAGDNEIELKLELLNKQMIEYKNESEKNASIKMKLASRVDTLVAENLHLKEKNLSLERRLKLLQGD